MASPPVVTIRGEAPRREAVAAPSEPAVHTLVARGRAAAAAAAALRPVTVRAGVQVASNAEPLDRVEPEPAIGKPSPPGAAAAPAAAPQAVLPPPRDLPRAPVAPPVPEPAVDLVPDDPSPAHDGRLPEVTTPIEGAVRPDGATADGLVAGATG